MKLLRRGTATPLFMRIFLLMLVCVAVVQILIFALLVAVQPPSPHAYTMGDIARVLQEGRDPSGQLSFTPREKIDRSILGPRADRARLALAMVLGAPADRVDFGFVKPPFPQRAQTYDPRSLPPAAPPRDLATARAFLVLDDFQASYRRADGSWVTIKPAAREFELWRWLGLLWLFFTAIAVVPFAWALSHRLAKPIGAFAAAAERLGRDPRAPPLALSGPVEIADAAAAFNQMQARLNRYVDDRTTVIGALAHDLRTPLMRLELRLEQATHELRAACEQDVRDMEAMVAATLAYVRDTSQPAARRPLDLRSLTESVTDDLSDRGQEGQARQAQRDRPAVEEGPASVRDEGEEDQGGGAGQGQERARERTHGNAQNDLASLSVAASSVWALRSLMDWLSVGAHSSIRAAAKSSCHGISVRWAGAASISSGKLMTAILLA